MTPPSACRASSISPASAILTPSSILLTQSLVTVEQLEHHFSLLHAFRNLRKSVSEPDAEACRYMPQLASQLDGDARWSWFVGLAVERFERWCDALTSDASVRIEDCMPPIDVVMVWHAYMLNPHHYAEDCIRLPILRGLKNFDGQLLQHTFLVTQPPVETRVQWWTQHTSTAFDHFKASAGLTNKTVVCPHCSTPVPQPFVNLQLTGYLQPDSHVSCTNTACKFEITKDSLALHKLVKVLIRAGDEPVAYLPGTIRTSTNAFDVSRARAIKAAINASLFRVESIDIKARISTDSEFRLMANVNFSLSTMTDALDDILKPFYAVFDRGAYQDDRPFSVDLMGAVFRQSSFTERIVPHAISKQSERTTWLLSSISMYHQFLELSSVTYAQELVPSIDIDLVWHTHQLMSAQYHNDCLQYVGYFLDHDDDVEESQVTPTWDLTCRLWESRFCIPCDPQALDAGEGTTSGWGNTCNGSSEYTPNLDTPATLKRQSEDADGGGGQSGNCRKLSAHRLPSSLKQHTRDTDGGGGQSGNCRRPSAHPMPASPKRHSDDTDSGGGSSGNCRKPSKYSFSPTPVLCNKDAGGVASLNSQGASSAKVHNPVRAQDPPGQESLLLSVTF